MYATCLFCHADLGRNEAIAPFPVGRRLAFDAAKGRLWVVCGRCERWNLTPLEERWEAIEAAERLFRDTRLRVSTDNVGLARLREGTELVRIGAPQRPEFAAWRYGDQFGRRRRRQLLVAGAVGAAGVGVIAGGYALGFSGLIAAQVGRALWRTLKHGRNDELVARFPRAGEIDGALFVERRHLRETRLLEGGGHRGEFALDVAHRGGRTLLVGADAQAAAVVLIPATNRLVGDKADVQRAVARIEHAGSSEEFLRELVRLGPGRTRLTAHAREPFWNRRLADEPEQTGLMGLAPSTRLAFEMALHEQEERRALEGELATLERAWRDAEEIAGIADDLLLPAGLDDRLAALRRDRATDARR